MTNATLGLKTIPYDFEGKTYEFSAFDIEDYGIYECWLESNLWDALRRARARDWITETELREIRRDALLILAAQELSFGSEAYDKSLKTLPGYRQQFLQSLRHKHPDITEETVDRMIRNDLAGMLEVTSHLNDPS